MLHEFNCGLIFWKISTLNTTMTLLNHINFEDYIILSLLNFRKCKVFHKVFIVAEKITFCKLLNYDK